MIPRDQDEHGRAKELLQLKYDGISLSSDDEAWLASHLSDCPRSQSLADGLEQLKLELSSWKTEQAPSGFAARLEERLDEAPSGWASWSLFKRWGRSPILGRTLAGLAVAVFGLLVWVGPFNNPEADLSVGGAAFIGETAPHFIIRPSGAGVARLRAMVKQLDAETLSMGLGHMQIRIERSDLIKVLARLEESGGVELRLGRDLGASETSVVLRLEFEQK